MSYREKMTFTFTGSYFIIFIPVMETNSHHIVRRIKAAGGGILAGLLLCELALRIYNPSPAAVRNGHLILPANQKKVFSNTWISKLDTKIFYSRNSLGFRGPEPPAEISNLMSVITVGGSTTECKFLSDSCTWPARLYQRLHKEHPDFWLNNAGIDGHTTFGHLLLVKEYILKIKPKYILLMTGVNDVELDQPDEFDRMSEKKINTSSARMLLKSLAGHTELGRAFLNYFQLRAASRKGLAHREIDFRKLVDNPLADSIMNLRLKAQLPYLTGYGKRVDSLVRLCQQAGITPILVTQPSLYGVYTDPATGVTVGGNWFANDPNGENCRLMESVLESYNDVLRSFSGRVPVIDLSRQMPKNSAFFYDFTHFTNAGASQAAAILDIELRNILFPSHSPNK